MLGLWRDPRFPPLQHPDEVLGAVLVPSLHQHLRRALLAEVLELLVQFKRVVADVVWIRVEVRRGKACFVDKLRRSFRRPDGYRDEVDPLGVQCRFDVPPELYGQLPAEESPERAHERHDGGLPGGSVDASREVDEFAGGGVVHRASFERGVRVGGGVGWGVAEGGCGDGCGAGRRARADVGLSASQPTRDGREGKGAAKVSR